MDLSTVSSVFSRERRHRWSVFGRPSGRIGTAQAGQPCSDDILCRRHSLLQRHIGRVQQDGIIGRLEGGIGPIAVSQVAFAQITNHLFRLLRRFGTELIKAAQPTHLGSRIEKDFGVGMGEDDRSNVAAFHHHPAFGAHLLLQSNHPGADSRKDADPGRAVGDSLVANQSGYVFAVEQNAILIRATFEPDGGLRGEPLQVLRCRPKAFRREAP